MTQCQPLWGLRSGEAVSYPDKCNSMTMLNGSITGS